MSGPRRAGIAIAVIIGVAVIGGLGGVIALRDHVATPATPVTDTPSDADASRAARSEGAPASVGTRPLRLIHDELVARAARGDARASCRLAAEFERCDGASERRHAMQTHLGEQQAMLDAARVPARSRGQMLENLDRQRSEMDRLAGVASQCDGVAPASAQDRADYWRQAALAGHLPSLRHYASGNAFRRYETLDVLPALQRYRTEAETLAVRGASQGDVELMVALAAGYAGGSDSRFRTYLAQAITPDLPSALAWYRLLDAHPTIAAMPATHPQRQAIGKAGAALEAAATPAERESATRIAAMHPMPAEAVETGGLHGRHFGAGSGTIHDIAPEACDSQQFAAG